jgi:ribosome-associated toxin RatA of RatAB toxin-antitoxin module
MPAIESSIEIAAEPADVFDLAQDYQLRLEWDPFLRAMRFRDGATQAAVGVRVWVRARTGLAMEVVYVALERPRRVAMKMVAGPWFFEHFAGTWRFDEVGPTRTRVGFKYNFETRGRWLRPALNPLIGRVFARDVARRLQGLKHAAEHTDILERLRAGRAGRGG